MVGTMHAMFPRVLIYTSHSGTTTSTICSQSGRLEGKLYMPYVKMVNK